MKYCKVRKIFKLETRRLLFLLPFLFFAFSNTYAQTAGTLTVDPNFDVTDSYSPGSSITLPIIVNGCFPQDNVFQIFLKPVGGSLQTIPIGSYASFWTAFVNGTIPIGTAPGSYQLVVQSKSPTSSDVSTAVSPSFTIAFGTVITAAVTGTRSLGILGTAGGSKGATAFGDCTGNSPIAPTSPVVLTANPTPSAGITTTGTIEDVQTTNTVVSTDRPFTGGKDDVSSTVTTKRDAYIYIVKATDGSVVGTQAYYIVNNSKVAATSLSVTNICIGKEARIGIPTNDQTGININFPGLLYIINWGDGTGILGPYTFCDIKNNLGGFLTHTYTQGSCGQSCSGNANAFCATFKTQSPYSISCTEATGGGPFRVSTPPIVCATLPKIYPDTFYCVNQDIIVSNCTKVGQIAGPTCSDAANYQWWVDGKMVRQYLNVSPPPNFDTAFTTPGTHSIKLVVWNDICGDERDITLYVCVEEPLIAKITSPASPVYNCVPITINPVGTPNTGTACRQFNPNWIVQDSASRNVITPGTLGYTITNGNTFTPTLTFTQSPPSGVFRVIFNLTPSTGSIPICGNLFDTIYVVALSAPTVTLPAIGPFCGAQTIDFSVAPNKPTYTNARGNVTYTWTVTETGTSPANYNFLNGTNANSKYPVIQFLDAKPSTYNVAVTITNICGNASANTNINFNQAVTATISTGDQSYCFNTNTINLSANATGLVDSTIWYTDGTGTFADRTSPNTIYTFSLADKNRGVVKLAFVAWASKSSGCPVSSDTIIVTFSKSNTGPNSKQDLCSGSALNFTPTSTVTGSTFAWTSAVTAGSITGNTASGTGNITDVLVNTSNSATGTVVYTITPTSPGSGGCVGQPFTFTVTVEPIVSFTANPETTICSGSSSAITMNTTGQTLSYTWTSSAAGGTLTGNSQQATPTTNNQINDILINTGTTTSQVIYIITGTGLGNCAFVLKDTVNVLPTPTTPNAGPDQLLCDQTTATLAGNVAVVGTGTWTQLPGAPAVTITNVNSPTSTVTGLAVSNTYQFVWTISNGTCPSKSDTVKIIDNSPLTNSLISGPQTICAGVTVTLTGDVPTGGTGSYTYIWQQSTDNINFTNIPNSNTQNITVSPIVTTWYQRLVTSGNCSLVTPPVQITVQGVITNNTVSPRQFICINTQPADLMGSAPTGGSGTFVYQWQSSSDGVTWTTIAGQTGQNYQQLPILTAPGDYLYRRLVSSGSCSGPQTSTSNVDTVTVNGNAKALFIATTTTACPPFNITNNIITNTSPQTGVNGSYVWLLNGVVLGTGASFPGTTISLSNQSITISLVAISAFGCKNDTMNMIFSTYQTPTPTFTVSISPTTGCTPLVVTTTNTTPNKASFTYTWNYGDGIGSSNVQDPGPYTYNLPAGISNATYNLVLTAIGPGGCASPKDTIPITIIGPPVAAFNPTLAVGCAPLTDTFVNGSRGVISYYLINFGDGTGDKQITPPPPFDSIIYTYTKPLNPAIITLSAVNSCGTNTTTRNIVVNPSDITLNIQVNGDKKNACAPDTVTFFNQSTAGSAFSLNWNFGDGSSTTTPGNQVTIQHIYPAAGNYNAVIVAVSTCSKATITIPINVLASPTVKFTAAPTPVCIGEPVTLTNLSQANTTAFLWSFGDGGTSSAITPPAYTYKVAGNYKINLIGSIAYPVGLTCSSVDTQTVQVFSTRPGSLQVDNKNFSCIPATVTFTNATTSSTIVNTTWDFGDGSPIQSGNPITYTYTKAGAFKVKMNSYNSGGCQYIDSTVITVSSPSGTFKYDNGYICNATPVRFSVIGNNISVVQFNFGDGSPFVTVSTPPYATTHTYPQAGKFTPSVVLINAAGCRVPIQGVDTIKPDFVTAGFTTGPTNGCGFTNVQFTDNSIASTSVQSWGWSFGDGTSSTIQNPIKTYATTNDWKVRLVAYALSGCTDTSNQTVPVTVNNKPLVNITSSSQSCSLVPTNFSSLVTSTDPITTYIWEFSDGYKTNTTTGSISHAFGSSGNYTVQLVVGTAAQCFDTAKVGVTIIQSADINAGPDQTICRGATAQLDLRVISGDASNYDWIPNTGLSCDNCPNPVAGPFVTTKYFVAVTSTNGCINSDSVTVNVVQPFTVSVSKNDTICSGQSTTLGAFGAFTYKWEPTLGLDNPYSEFPNASPIITTWYYVNGYTTNNCFSPVRDSVLVTVGQPIVIDIAPGTTVLPGTPVVLSPTTSDPVESWSWTPTNNLSCSNCQSPTAVINNDICYTVTATSVFGCSSNKQVCYKAFCPQALIFIPNTFVPTSGSGDNSTFMVRSQAPITVLSMNVYNRWGQLVFQSINGKANDATAGWDGKINGKPAQVDTYVYVCRLMCTNGQIYDFQGNVTILK